MGNKLPMKSKGVKVSVIMPAYNAASSIDAAIQSVLAQKGVLFELLIGDDASTDGTWMRIRTFQTDPRVRATRFQRNQGAALTSNRLIAQARGEYLSSCDADDVMLPENLLVLTRVLDKHPAVGVAYGDLFVTEPRGCSWIKRRFVPKKAWDLLGGCFANGGTLIRRSLIRKVGGYRPDLAYLEDCDLFLRLAEHTRFYHLAGKPLYCQRKSPGSLSDQPSKKLRKVSQKILRDAIQRRYGTSVGW